MNIEFSAAGLRGFIAAQSDKATVWGASDCCTFGGDWAIALGYGDPVAAWRGRYDSETGALALLGGPDGLTDAVSEGLKSIGWRAGAVAFGSVAVLDLPGCSGGWNSAVAVCGKDSFALRGPRGVTLLPRADHRVRACFGAE